ncbi:MAG: DUF4129 domain-containing protein [Candidatus Limnocylindria bacterium]
MATAGIADADTVELAAYRSRLRDTRALVIQARVAADAQRPALLERARTTLLQTTAVRTADGSVIAIDDSRVARRLSATAAAIDAAVGDVDQLIGIADRAANAPFNVAEANARLRDLAAVEEARSGSNDLFAAIGELLARLFPSAGAQLPPGSVEITLTIAGAGLLVVILVILVRGVRERIRRETVQPGAHAEAAASAAVQLAAAERAALSGDPRTALHAFYRYAILTLAERRILRYEPSLTDRELLERASSLPQVETLRELISLHDRAWFGLKGATAEEADHARALAERALA